ncbi:Ig-like domain-containing protein [Acinetobacter terrestris]|uniref:Ig-like domain-containing protein n=1 Tax=Acinetobacter terrestris TaxID=2529843 RepID=UPI0035255119
MVVVNGQPHILTAADIAAGEITALVAVQPGTNAIVVEVTNSKGQVERDITVVEVVSSDLTGNVSVVEDSNADQVLNASEKPADNLIDVKVNLGQDIQEGDTVEINGIVKPVTSADISLGYVIIENVGPVKEDQNIFNVIVKDSAAKVIEEKAITVTVDTKPAELIDGIKLIADQNVDGILNAKELATNTTSTQIEISLGRDAKAGDTISLNGIDYIITANDWLAGKVITNVAIAENANTIIAKMTDAQGNIDQAQLDFSVDTQATDLVGTIQLLDDVSPADGAINKAELGADNRIDISIPLTGANKPGDVINVNGDNYVLKQSDIDAGKLDVSIAVREGQNDIAVKSTDTEGNVDSSALSFLVDTQTVNPVITAISTTGGGNYAADKAINADELANPVILNGTAEPNSKVVVAIEGLNTPYTVTAGPTGEWNVTLTTSDLATLNSYQQQQADSSLDIEITATDTVGNVSATVYDNSILLDSTAPVVAISVNADGVVELTSTEPLFKLDNGVVTAASLQDIADRLDSDQGKFIVVTPTGNAQPYIQFVPMDPNSAIDPATVDLANVDFYGPVTVTLPQGTFTDQVGNANAAAQSTVSTVDLSLPPTLTITSDSYVVNAADSSTLISFKFSELVSGFDVNDVHVTGGSLSNLRQDVNNPEIYTAVFTPDAGNNVAGKITVDPGAFSSTTTGKTNDTAASLAGPGVITGDVIAPPKVQLSLAEDTTAATAGSAFNDQKQDGITKNPTIQVTGLEPNLGWQYSTDGGNTWQTGAAAGDPATTGSFDLPAQGQYKAGDIQVRQYDGSAAGNDNTTISKFNKAVTLDSTGPTVTISSIADGNGIDEGERAFGYTVKGSTDPNAIVTVTITGASGTPHTANVTADATGAWSYKVPGNAVTYPAAGSNITITATAKDEAGNVSTVPDIGTATITKVPTFNIVQGNVTAKIAVVAGDDVINATEKANLTFYGSTNITTNYVKLYKVGESTALINKTITAGTGDKWSMGLTAGELTSLADGEYRIEIAGISGVAVDTRTFTVDTSIAKPTFTITDDANQNILTDKAGYSNDASPTWSGKTEPGAIVEVKIGDVSYGAVKVDSNGDWTITAEQPIPDASHTVTVQVTDAAGNKNSATHSLIVDTVAPELSIDQPVAVDDILTAVELQQGLTISGTAEGAEDGQIVEVTVNGLGPVDATVTNGQWSVKVPSTLLDDITWTDNTKVIITANVTDKAGNAAQPESLELHYKDNNLDKAGSIVEFSEDDLLLGANADTGLNFTGQFAIPSTNYTQVYLEQPATPLTSQGLEVLWEHNSNGDLIGYVNKTVQGQVVKAEVVVVSIDDNGNYSVNLKQAIGHGAVDTTLNDILAFDIRMNFANDRGDVSASQYITVKMTDDSPTAKASETYNLTNSYEVTGNVFVEYVTQPDNTVTTNVYGYGADGGFVKSVTVSGVEFVFDPKENTVTQKGSSAEIITYAYNYKGLEGGELLVTTLSGETITFDLATGEYHYSVFEAAPGSYNQPEPVSVSLGGQSNSLLGAVGLNVAGLIDLQNNQLFSVSGQGMHSVEVSISAVDVGGLLGTILGNSKELLFNAKLATELGLKVVSQKATLSLSMMLTITNLDGTEINNLDALKVNQLLQTVTIDGGALGGILDLSVLPTVKIEAKNNAGTTLVSKSNTELANVGLLGDLLSNEKASTVIVDDGARSSELRPIDNNLSYSIYGLGGNDLIQGGNANDILYGGSGNDTIVGGAGNDLIVGGQGNDIMTGGEGSDIFRWEKNDYLNGFNAAVDRITDFDTSPVALGGDVLDFSNLLVGAGRFGFSAGNLVNYLHFTYDATTNQTIIYMSKDGLFTGGFSADLHMSSVNQVIKLDNVNLLQQGEGTYAAQFNSDYEVINSLVANGKLITNAINATSSSTVTDVKVVVQDNDGDTASTDLKFDTTNLTDVSFNPNNQAPLVFGKDTSLLGLVGLDVLGLIELGAQDIYVIDPNNDLRQVTLTFEQVLGVNVTKPTFTYSSTLATELGIKAEISITTGVLNLIAPTMSLTITSANGLQPNISNAAINQFLATVKFTTEDAALGIVDGNLLSLDLLNNIKVTATDSQNISTTESLGKLLDVSLITKDSGLNSGLNLIEGDDAVDRLDGSASAKSAVIYGYDGDDILTGSRYNDTIYGGRGNDTINAGDGKDYVSGGEGDDTIYGGNGDDSLWGNQGNDILYGGTGNNTLNGGAGNDEFHSQAVGRDTVIYDLLNADDATGGHGSDTWYGFQKGNTEFNANADVFDISELLNDFDHGNYEHLLINNGDVAGAQNYLGQYVSVQKVGDDTVISIDRDGKTYDASNKLVADDYPTNAPLLTLKNVDTSLEELLHNNQLLF